MKKLLFSLASMLIFTVVGMTTSGNAMAATYKMFTAWQGDGWWSETHKLRKGQTKEYRYQCKSSTDGHVLKTGKFCWKMEITGLKSTTTCTVTVAALQYLSRSCTNWSAFNNDTLTIKMKCPYEC